jgi:hypothetical protein
VTLVNVVSVESPAPRATLVNVVSVESPAPRATLASVVTVVSGESVESRALRVNLASVAPRVNLAGWTRKLPHLCNASPPGQPRAILAGDAKSPQLSPPELFSTVASETGASSPPAAVPGTPSLSTTAPTSQI